MITSLSDHVERYYALHVLAPAAGRQLKVAKIFDAVEAFIQGIAGPRDEGILKLKRLHARDRLCPQITGALSFLAKGRQPPETGVPIVPQNATSIGSRGMNFPKPRGDSYNILEVARFKAALDSAHHYETHYLACPAFDSDLSLLSKALELARPSWTSSHVPSLKRRRAPFNTHLYLRFHGWQRGQSSNRSDVTGGPAL
jgi:hypothetical protein